MEAEPFEGTITNFYVLGRNKAGTHVMNSLPQFADADAKAYLEELMRVRQDAVKQFDDALATAAGVRGEESASSGSLFFPFGLIVDIQRHYLKQCVAPLERDVPSDIFGWRTF